MNQWELPLGWTWREPGVGATAFHTVALDNGTVFLHCADLAETLSPAEVAERAKSLGKRVILKGCSLEMVNAVHAAGGGHLILGHAARIALDGYKPPHKARNLARKGDKVVEVVARAIGPEAEAIAQSFLAEVHPPGTPRLRLNYRTEITDTQRAFFAHERNGGRTVGLITLTKYGPGAWHVEQLARHPAAPLGTMEAVVTEVIDTLRAENAHAVNLGEATMYFPRADGEVVGWQHFGQRNRWIARSAPVLTRAVRSNFNARGLYQFKNKFKPQWEPRALCGFPRVRIRDVVAMARACGIVGLVHAQLVRRIVGGRVGRWRGPGFA